MKNLTKLTAVALLIVSAASCDKVEDVKKTTTPSTTPASPSAASPTPSGGDISGALISIQMKYSYNMPNVPMPVSLESEIGTAVFYSAPGSSTMVDAGNVSVNTVQLEKATNNAYTKMATAGLTPSTLNMVDASSSKWSVAGAGSVAGFTYDHTIAFPKYTGTIPTSVTKSSGISMPLSGSVSGADSVYVLVAAGNVSVLKAFAATATNITISAADLAGLPNVSDNTALFEVCPFKWNITTQGGKKYVAIKEQAIVQNININ